MKVMKYIFRIVIGMALVLASFSCSRMDVGEEHGTGSHTYRMRFECNIDDLAFLDTKSGYAWEEGALVHIQFTSKGTRIKGTATYKSSTGEWLVTAEKALSNVEKANCEVYWFNGLKDPSAEPLSIGPNVSSFKDVEATYSLFEGGLLVVSARLVSMTSRLRFVGEPGCTFMVDGLKYCSEYSMNSNLFTRVADSVSVTIGPDGSSDFYYVTFADTKTRVLTIEGEYNTLFTRTFSDDVLEIGTSGFMTAPTPSDPGNWSFLNKENMEEVRLATVTETEVDGVRGTSAGFEAQITDNGNGVILASGFVFGKEPSPTLGTAYNYSCGTSETLSVRIGGLDKVTTYYVRAFVRNPKGLTYGPESSFTTTDQEDGITNDSFDDGEHNWNDSWGDDSEIVGGDSIGKDDWTDDRDWNENWGGDTPSDGDSIGKDDWSEDKDWNENWGGDNPSDGDSIGKDDWSDDEDWNEE